MLRRAAPGIGALAALALAPSAHADTSLATAAAALAHDLGVHGSLVVASPLTSDVGAPRGSELAARVATLVASAVGGAAESRPLSLAAAQGKSRARASLVYVDVRVASGELRLTGDVYPTVSNAWDRLRSAPAPPTAHAYVHVPISAEVRAYLDPLHLERAELTKFTEDVGPVLAVACGDLGVGGERQLVLVTDKEVASGHLARGRFIAAHHAAARSLGQRLPVPFREPIATAAIVDSALFVGWGDRSGASMRADLAPVDHLGGLPVAAGNVVECVELDPPHGSIGDEPKRCSDADAPATPRTGRPLLDAWASFDLARPDGATERVVASHEPTGLLHLSGHGTATVPDVGAQVGVADLDEDGVPEVVTTNARGEDALVISSWRAGGVATRLRWAAPAGVDAVAVCPPESSDRPAMVVAAVGKELWLVR